MLDIVQHGRLVQFSHLRHVLAAIKARRVAGQQPVPARRQPLKTFVSTGRAGYQAIGALHDHLIIITLLDDGHVCKGAILLDPGVLFVAPAAVKIVFEFDWTQKSRLQFGGDHREQRDDNAGGFDCCFNRPRSGTCLKWIVSTAVHLLAEHPQNYRKMARLAPAPAASMQRPLDTLTCT